jgi:hypothetical protein
MEALKMYESVLRELNRFGSPRYDIDDHNFFVNKAKDYVIEEIIKNYELNQRLTELLQGVVKFSAILLNATDKTSKRIGDLPLDFDSLKSCTVVFRVKEDFSCYKKGQLVSHPARRLTEDSEMFVHTNSYYWPSFVKENIYYQTREKKIEIFYDTANEPENRVVIDSVKIEHTVHPADIILAQNKTNVSNSVFHKKVNTKIIERTALLFLENSTNQRTQSFSQTNQ